MYLIPRLVSGSVHQDRLGFGAVTNDLRVSTAYSKKKVRFFQVGCGFSPLCLGPRVTEWSWSTVLLVSGQSRRGLSRR